MSESGFYSPGSTVLHRGHGATKVVLFLVAVPVLPLVLNDPRAIAALAGGLTVMVAAARIRVGRLLLFAPALPIVLLAALSWLLFAGDMGGAVLWQAHLGPVTYALHQTNLDRALIASASTAVWALSYVLLLTTTRSRDLVAGLERLHVPHRVSRAVAMTLRYWATVGADSRQVADAQRARGFELDGRGRLLNLARLVSATAVPTLFLMLKRFQTLNFALVLRGLGGGPVTRVYAPTLRAVDLVLAAGVAILAVVVWLLDTWMVGS